MVDGILWIKRTGSPWRDLPEEFGKWGTVWDLFDKWNSDGTLDEILFRLRTNFADFDSELWCVDGTTVRAARCATGGGKKGIPRNLKDHALGRSRGGFSTKIHLLCDSAGNPIHFHLTPGQAHEASAFDRLMQDVDDHVWDEDGEPLAWPIALAGDKGYRANWIDEYLLELDIKPVIPSKVDEDRTARPVEFDREAYRARNIIERLIGWLKENRRIFSRFEKTAKNFGGFLKMAFIHRYLQIAVT